MGNTLTCVYCGQEYPAGTPVSGADVKALTDHIKGCEKHPLYKLRKALADLIGASTKGELEVMEIALRAAPGIEEDKIVAINAIHALLEMPLLGYKKEFANLVESGEKHQTIRATRKRPFRIGDRLYHYVGLRTKQCRKLLESDCIAAEDILIEPKGDVYINGLCMLESMKESFAYDDGFRPPGFLWEQMFNFFKTVHGLPFNGQLIKW